MIPVTRITGFQSSRFGLLVPVEIPNINGNSVQGQWNMRVRRWHRRAGK